MSTNSLFKNMLNQKPATDLPSKEKKPSGENTWSKILALKGGSHGSIDDRTRAGRGRRG
jgi:hypothetical protein